MLAVMSAFVPAPASASAASLIQPGTAPAPSAEPNRQIAIGESRAYRITNA